MMDPLDGNAIGGDLLASFGREMTALSGTCSSCGARSVIAELRVYMTGPGAVARCPGCGDVAMVVVRGAVHVERYRLPTEPGPGA
jgi:ribosomal protein S27AE